MKSRLTWQCPHLWDKCWTASSALHTPVLHEQHIPVGAWQHPQLGKIICEQPAMLSDWTRGIMRYLRMVFKHFRSKYPEFSSSLVNKHVSSFDNMLAMALGPRIIVTVLIKIRVALVKCKNITLFTSLCFYSHRGMWARARDRKFTISNFISIPAEIKRARPPLSHWNEVRVDWGEFYE